MRNWRGVSESLRPFASLASLAMLSLAACAGDPSTGQAVESRPSSPPPSVVHSAFVPPPPIWSGTTTVDLIAGTHPVVGTVTAAMVGDKLEVSYALNAPWSMTESELDIETDVNRIPHDGATAAAGPRVLDEGAGAMEVAFDVDLEGLVDRRVGGVDERAEVRVGRRVVDQARCASVRQRTIQRGERLLDPGPSRASAKVAGGAWEPERREHRARHGGVDDDGDHAATAAARAQQHVGGEHRFQAPIFRISSIFTCARTSSEVKSRRTPTVEFGPLTALPGSAAPRVADRFIYLPPDALRRHRALQRPLPSLHPKEPHAH
jgi:hypothetical protein